MKYDKRLIVGNWKMNHSRSEASTLVSQLREPAAALRKSEMWIAPPAVHLDLAGKLLEGSRIKLGAQQVHWAGSGPFTGEISLPMLQELGCTFTLVGHSERRHTLGEPSDHTLKRGLAVLEHSTLDLVYCVGETLDERERNQTRAILELQLLPLLQGMQPTQHDRLIIAYEPVWAIGTGRVATEEQVASAHVVIRGLCEEILGSRVTILYGGSFTPENAEMILAHENVYGVLVGGASLVADKFLAIVDAAERSNWVPPA